MADNLPQITIQEDGKDCVLTLRPPTTEDYNQADKIKSKVFYESLKDGLPTNDELEKILIERNIWSKEHQREAERIKREIADKEYKLSKGGIKLSKAKKIALEIRQLREDYKTLNIQRILHIV